MEYCDDDREYIRPPRKTDLFSPDKGVDARMTLQYTIQMAAKAMMETPSLLEREPLEMMKKLKQHCDTNGQGSANPVTRHEACIAEILEEHGIKLAHLRNIAPTEDGLYFWYQAGGTQQKGDFTAFSVKDGRVSKYIILDAKHSNGMSIYLNDGTFEVDVIYIVSFTRCLERIKGRRKKPRENVCFIGLGQDIFTEKDRISLEKWRKTIRELNDLGSDTDHLRLYARSANQYDCHRFTPEFAKVCWNHLEASLAEQSDKQTELELHFQSV